MIISSFQIDEKLQLISFAEEKVEEILRDSDARIWIDLEGFQKDDLAQWLDKLNIQALTRRLCLESYEQAGFYPLKKEIFFVVPVLIQKQDSKRVAHIAFLLRDNLLFTFHQESVLHAEKFSSIQEVSDSWLSERSIAALVAAMMVRQSQESLKNVTDLRKAIFEIEDRMDRVPETIEAEEIMDIRSNLLTLGAIVSDQIPSLQSLSSIDKMFFKLKDSQAYMNCALTNLQAADGSLSWLDQRVGSLHSGFQMHAQDNTNRRLNMLTILSAIFTPMTFLAGIWGMNFAVMPELGLPYGYFMGLGLMALIGGGMFFFLRRNGWFD